MGLEGPARLAREATADPLWLPWSRAFFLEKSAQSDSGQDYWGATKVGHYSATSQLLEAPLEWATSQPLGGHTWGATSQATS